MSKLIATDGEVQGRISKSSVLVGHVCAVGIIGIFLVLNVVATIQMDFWQNYFFYDSYAPTEQCSVFAQKSKSETWDRDAVLSTTPTQISIPHPKKPLVILSGTGEVSQVIYKCHFQDKIENRLPGITYLHMGWVFGSKAKILVNNSERVSFSGNDKIIIPLNENDLKLDYVDLEVDVVGRGDQVGLMGFQPLVFTDGNQKNAKVLGLEIALQQVRYLYAILPVLSVALMFILGWITGMRSRLLVALLYYFAMIALRNLMTLFADLWPWDILTTYNIARAFYTGVFASFCILVMELTRTKARFIPKLMMAISVVVAIEFVAFFFYRQLVQVSDFVNSVAFPSVMYWLIYEGKRKLSELNKERRRVNIVLLSVVSIYATLTILDFLLTKMGISIRLANKIDIIMPLCIGGIVLYALSLIQKEYQVEKVKREKFERDLELARDIQDSLNPPPSQTLFGNCSVVCYQLKHDQVAGDWMALRTLEDHTVLALVADATGKGVQAALVVHAVQSLWADALSSESFDVPSWIQRVNRTLIRMGEKKAHSLTLGILTLKDNVLTYWSAGHVPVFVLTQTDKELQVTPLAKPGSSLGIKEEIKIQSASMNLDLTLKNTIILGSDGVFDRGSRTSRKEILSLMDRITEMGEQSLIACPAEDDKTMILIESKPAA